MRSSSIASPCPASSRPLSARCTLASIKWQSQAATSNASRTMRSWSCSSDVRGADNQSSMSVDTMSASVVSGDSSMRSSRSAISLPTMASSCAVGLVLCQVPLDPAPFRRPLVRRRTNRQFDGCGEIAVAHRERCRDRIGETAGRKGTTFAPPVAVRGDEVDPVAAHAWLLLGSKARPQNAYCWDGRSGTNRLPQRVCGERREI